MHVFEMVVWIVAIGTLGGIYSQHQKNKHKAQQHQSLNKESEKRINDLEERVRVLEKIATDKRSRLSDEIDSL